MGHCETRKQGSEARGRGTGGGSVHPFSLGRELQASGTIPGPTHSRQLQSTEAPRAEAAMTAEEKLDPIPDSFILQPPAFLPVVPYVTTIFGGLHTGKMVMLQGAVPRDAHRFQVDFQCGCSLDPRPDIAIHFNPRFHTTRPHVICNTLRGGRWQTEARWPGLPLQRGASFLILFLFGHEEVKVSVNGQHLLRYRYRLPLSRVDTLGIFGDISVQAVGFLNISPFAEGSREYPAGHRFFEVLLLCQEGALKLALNGQGLGAVSLGQQVLERLREVQVRGSVQLYCVHC